MEERQKQRKREKTKKVVTQLNREMCCRRTFMEAAALTGKGKTAESVSEASKDVRGRFPLRVSGISESSMSARESHLFTKTHLIIHVRGLTAANCPFTINDSTWNTRNPVPLCTWHDPHDLSLKLVRLQKLDSLDVHQQTDSVQKRSTYFILRHNACLLCIGC